jgi:hypothetical protein
MADLPGGLFHGLERNGDRLRCLCVILPLDETQYVVSQRGESIGNQKV